MQQNIYKEIETILADYCPEENVCLIYLTCKDSAETSFSRLIKRNTEGEEEISSEYAKRINSYTENFVNEWKYNKLCISTSAYHSEFNSYMGLFINEQKKIFLDKNKSEKCVQIKISDW